jgi:nitrite reductase/ring-hydroxylating ferredoxin subunit
MKKYILFIVTCILLLGCSDNENSNKNPYIPNYNFSVDINLDLPLYLSLKSPGNGIFYTDPRLARGLIIFNTGNNNYNAFDAACPNQELSDCSTMTIKGINALCACDKTEYNLFTGQGGQPYPMKQYRVQVNGDALKIYN